MEFGLWRLGSAPERITSQRMPQEKQLEDLIEADPAVLGAPLLIIGRQVPTAYGHFIDLLALDESGHVHILELKRDKTPRDVIAQVLDYASWVTTLGHADITMIYASYGGGAALEEAFADRFGTSLPDELNSDHRLTVIASALDASTERIVRYLVEQHAVPVNVAFFRYFKDGDSEYLARTWLLPEAAVSDDVGRPKRQSATREPWNGTDMYVAFGTDSGNRAWEDARTYGFVSASGGAWYTSKIRGLPEGMRVWVHVPGAGYVGTGTVTGPAVLFREMRLGLDGPLLAEQNLQGAYRDRDSDDDDAAEWAVPVAWDKTVDQKDAVWKPSMFANQNIACRMTSSFTLTELASSVLRLDGVSAG
jgi:hypothetical protein